MKCTIQNIADHLGLSRNTVSKALKNSPEVSENTRNLVIKTASELGYKNATFVTPVIPASETGSNGTILFLTKTYASDSEFWTTVLRGIESILSNANYHLAISIMSDSDLKQLNFPQTISDSSIKGIILVEICDKVVCDALSQFNLPIVSVDMPNVPFEELNGIDVVTMESKKNLKKIINQLIKKGVTFDGIFATNDWRAYGALVALQENGIKVPEQVKLIGFDDIFIASTSHPTLSTIRQDTPALAKTACDLLLDLMNKEDNTEELQKRYVLPVEIIRRESTA